MTVIIAIPQILNERLTEEGAKALVAIVDRAVEESEKVTLQIAEERFERRVAQVEAKIEVAKAEVISTGERTRADLIKWMFIFWVGQIGVLTGILFAFFRK